MSALSILKSHNNGFEDCNFFVTGIKVSSLLDTMITWDDDVLARLTLLDRKEEGKKARTDVCKNHIVFSKTRGLLLADAMGLGKTVVVSFN